MKKVVVGDILVQDNQERKFGADPQYAVVWVVKSDEGTIPLVLTRTELAKAIVRGKYNPEDVPELGSEAPINEWDAE